MRSSAVVLLALLTACGFQLRGTTVATNVESAHVEAVGRVRIESDLRRALEQAGVVMNDDRAAAQVSIALLGEESQRRTLSVTERVRTAEYELTRSVRYRVTGRGDEVLLDERTISASRVYVIDRDNLVASDQEAQLLDRELGADLVAQIVRSLDATTRTPR